MGEWSQRVEVGAILSVASEDGAGVSAGTRSVERA
ncbi:hypothetical protein EHYA_00010 [Embleya hyalina]|uniref:Uncharacterized protein n=1 Tax=Embleya hyalina TaxID=516124 RepID=A0A401YCS4_9ACTN|nr:hypothetical protein EHYA_00010 [Embleya hyalina]